jgi:hypothetical protein
MGIHGRRCGHRSSTPARLIPTKLAGSYRRNTVSGEKPRYSATWRVVRSRSFKPAPVCGRHCGAARRMDDVSRERDDLRLDGTWLEGLHDERPRARRAAYAHVLLPECPNREFGWSRKVQQTPTRASASCPYCARGQGQRWLTVQLSPAIVNLDRFESSSVSFSPYSVNVTV